MSCSDVVPSNYAWFKKSIAAQLKSTGRYLKRRIFMLLTLQNLLERKRFPEDIKKVLWINMTAPSLGDALMDTAGRVLLEPFELTLVTHEANAPLFENDPFFKKVYARNNLPQRVESDFVILDSYSPRTVFLKLRLAPSKRYVGLFGYLNAYEVHRAIFSFRRLEWLTGKYTADTVYLTVGLSRGVKGYKVAGTKKRLAIAVGGEWAFRTYGEWGAVIERLASHDIDILLVGSSNGCVEALRLADTFGERLQNFVGATTISEVAAILRGCDAFVGADGGLWHLASACGVPSVALHADCQLYDHEGKWCSRAAHAPVSVALRGEKSVNEILPRDVVSVVLQILALDRKT